MLEILQKVLYYFSRGDNMDINAVKKGFLHEDFRIFHLNDSRAQRVPYHYHEFDKLVLLLSGSVTYFIEGAPYVMKPGDLLFVPHGSIHKPVIVSTENYERYVIWVMPDFLESRSREGEDLAFSISSARKMNDYMISLDAQTRLDLILQLSRIQESLISDKYGARLMSENLFSIFMLTLARICEKTERLSPSPRPDDKILGIMDHIDRNLGGDLSVEHLSSVFFISRYHLMRKFKAQSGYTLHQYITRRRILTAAEMIGSGTPASKAAQACGYEDYSAFLRAFRSVLGASPRSFSTLAAKKDITDE